MINPVWLLSLVLVGCASFDASGSSSGAGGAGGSPGGGGSPQGAGCANIGGIWRVSGSCGLDRCVITQSGCQASLSCSDGASAYSGSVDGDAVNYSGKTGDGVPSSCSGKLSGDTLLGTCNPAGSPACEFASTREQGGPGAGGAGGAGAGGSGGNAAGGPPDVGCPDIAGEWQISGTCGPDVCTISQAGCEATLKCSNGASSYTGSIVGQKITYTGKAGNGVPATCSGTLAGDTLAGTCTPVGSPPCSFAASKK